MLDLTAGQQRVVELALPQTTRSRLTKAAVEADTSNSHVVQHVLASRLPNLEDPQ